MVRSLRRLVKECVLGITPNVFLIHAHFFEHPTGPRLNLQVLHRILAARDAEALAARLKVAAEVVDAHRALRVQAIFAVLGERVDALGGDVRDLDVVEQRRAPELS